jgi:hypothetical protein
MSNNLQDTIKLQSRARRGGDTAPCYMEHGKVRCPHRAAACVDYYDARVVFGSPIRLGPLFPSDLTLS